MRPAIPTWPRGGQRRAWALLHALVVTTGLVAVAAAPPAVRGTVYVSQSGTCSALAPPSAVCATLKDALRNQAVTRVVLIDAVMLQQGDWAQDTR
jgi:hypothetical protein